MVGKKAKEIPLAEITLRKYERPFDLERREIFKKICLSLGLLQPGDSRDVIIDVFQVIVDNKELTSDDIVEKVIASRKKEKLELLGIAPSNIMRPTSPKWLAMFPCPANVSVDNQLRHSDRVLQLYLVN